MWNLVFLAVRIFIMTSVQTALHLSTLVSISMKKKSYKYMYVKLSMLTVQLGLVVDTKQGIRQRL